MLMPESNGRHRAEPLARRASLIESFERGVLTLTLNRPQHRNALDADLAHHLLGALLQVQERPEVRCVVITGAGTAFCSGDDIGSLDDFLAGGDATNAPAFPGTQDAYYLRIIAAILACRAPVVAAINGAAAGAGTELACAADLRIASDRARIGSCLINVAQVGTAVMLPRVVGVSHATEIYLSGRLVDADEALRIGLVHRVVAARDFPAEVDQMATDLAARPTAAIGLFKELRDRALGQPVELGLRLQDAFHQRNHREVADEPEGLRAFVEKRPPRFEGR